MKDEEFVFRQDVREKASTARSARSRRTHNGKSGRVKFPSDYMTEKEKKAMSGEVKSYRLNDPMTWKEFKAMPDDIKITYIKLLREKFGVNDSKIAEMLGIGQNAVSREVLRLGINLGRGSGNRRWDKEGWLAWCNGVPVPQSEEVPEAVGQHEPEAAVSLGEIAPFEPATVPDVKVLPVREEKPKAIPSWGNMVFEGKAEEVLNAVAVLLGGADVHISITWDVLDDGRTV